MANINYLLLIFSLLTLVIAQDDFEDFFKDQLDGDVGYDKEFLLYAPGGKNFVKNVINVRDGMVTFKQGGGPQASMTLDPASGMVNFGAKIPPCRDGFERTPTGFCVPFPEKADDEAEEEEEEEKEEEQEEEEEKHAMAEQKSFRIQRPVRRHGDKPIPHIYRSGRIKEHKIEDENPCDFCKDFPCGRIVKCTHYVRV